MSPLLPGIIASGISGHLYTPEGSAYEIAKYTAPSGGVAEVTFAIPSGYRHIRVESSLFTTVGGGSPQIRFNGDSGNNYSNHMVYGTGTAASIGYNTSNSGMYFGGANIGTTTNYPLTSIIDVLDYASTSKNKTVKTFTGLDSNGNSEIALFGGAWYNASSPVSSMTIYASGKTIAENSTFTLIGYK